MSNGIFELKKKLAFIAALSLTLYTAGYVPPTKASADVEQQTEEHEEFDIEAPVCSVGIISDESKYFADESCGESRLWFGSLNDIVLSVNAEITADGNGAEHLIISINGRQSVIPVTDRDKHIDTEKLANGGYNIVFSEGDSTDTFSAELTDGDITIPLHREYRLMEGGKLEVELRVKGNDENERISDKVELYADNSAPCITAVEAEGADLLCGGIEPEYALFADHDIMLEVRTNCEMRSGISCVKAVFLDAEGNIINSETYSGNCVSIPVPVGFKGRVELNAVNNLGRVSEKAVTQLFAVEGFDEHLSSSQACVELPDTPYRDENGNRLYRSDIEAKFNVRDGFSGISSLSLSADGALVGEESLSEALSNGLMTVEKSDEKSIVTELSGSIRLQKEANGSEIALGFADNAGNSQESAANAYYSIDRTAPVVDIELSAADKSNGRNVFNSTCKAVIRVKERNFDVERMSVKINGNEEKLRWERADDESWYAERSFDADGNYKLSVSGSDRCERKSNECSKSFVIDKTAPVLTAVYDSSPVSKHYYGKSVSALFTINEKNFDPSLIELSGTFNGSAEGFSKLLGWKKDGDSYSAALKFEADGDYTVKISGKDIAGNALEPYTASFCVDSTKPTVGAEIVRGSGKSSEIRPCIFFEDANIKKESIKISVDGAVRGNDLDWGGHLAETSAGYEYIFDNIPDEEENDDIYTINASAVDSAENKIEKSIRFVVNRYGSVFELDQNSRVLRGRFMPSGQDVVIIEKNPDRHSAPQNIYITKDSETLELKEGADYSVETVGSENEWSEYIYTVYAKNFENDARYSVSVHSMDEAGNINISNSEEKNADIDFCIDKTKPTCVPLNINENTAYKNDKLTAHLAVTDNIMLKNVKVYIDGKEVRSRYFEDECQFDITDSNHAQNIRVVLTDMAENEMEYNYRNILVTSSAIRILAHKAWFRICCGASVLLAGASAVIFRKRKKRFY